MRQIGLAALLLALVAPSSAGKAGTAAPAAEALQIAGPVLMVNDLERSVRFYTEGLRMTVASRLPGKPGPGVLVVGPGRQPPPFILLRQRQPAARGGPPGDVADHLSRIMLSVPDALAAAARLKAAGYAVPELNGRQIFFVTDPDGYRYEVMQISRRK